MRTLAELQALTEEYAAVAFPDSHEIDTMSAHDIRENTARMYAAATRIADLVIEAGLHHGKALR